MEAIRDWCRTPFVSGLGSIELFHENHGVFMDHKDDTGGPKVVLPPRRVPGPEILPDGGDCS